MTPTDPIREALERLVAAETFIGEAGPEYQQAVAAALAAALLEQLSIAQAPQPVAVSGWQPIDTAPKDGTEILASDGYDAIDIVSWCKGRFELGVPGEWVNRDCEAFFPCWWQPLPDHPPLPEEAQQ